MLKKILALNGVGRFEAYKAHGDVEFKKFTLIFAENGIGKTTLGDVIRSLQTGNVDILKGRRTLGINIDQAAKMLLADGSVAEFKEGVWNKRPPGGVAIFDASYIRDNVHAGEVVDTEHKRNLFQVIVGAEGVRLVKLVTSLEKQRSELNTPIRTAKAAMDAVLPAGMSIDQFIAVAKDDTIDDKIAQAQTDLAAAMKAKDIKDHRVPVALVAPVVPAGLFDLLGKTLDGIAEEAEELLREHAAHLGKEGQTWLSTGTRMITDEACPFCGQDIKGNDLVAAYRACFSAAYRDLADMTGKLPAALGTTLGPMPVGKIEQTLSGNQEAIAWWKDYAAVEDLPAFDLDAAKATLSNALKLIGDLVEKKRGNLLEAVLSTPEADAAMAILDELGKTMAAYNEAVTARNAVLQATKAKIESADAATAGKALKKLQALKKRHEQPLAGHCDEYAKLVAEREDLGKRKDVAKDALDDHTDKVVGTYENSLNAHLKKFLVGFRIKGTKAEFPRGIPTSNYQLLINGVEVDVGSNESPDSEPTFKNTLSGGDRSALALALFMAQLDDAAVKPEIAILLDDPFQSQDAFRRTATAFEIKRAGDKVQQVIVMSHDAHFLKLLWDELPNDQRKALRLHAVGDTTTMSEWDIYEHLKSDHQQNITSLQRYIDEGKGAPRDVAQKLRPTLEGHCKLVAYGQFGDSDMMGEIIKTVREEGKDHVLYAILDRLEELNSYARRYHHATNVDAATEPLSEAELKGYAEQILELMRVRSQAA